MIVLLLCVSHIPGNVPLVLGTLALDNTKIYGILIIGIINNLLMHTLSYQTKPSNCQNKYHFIYSFIYKT